jgi:soluble lytic murein transglycosylase-like protein
MRTAAQLITLMVCCFAFPAEQAKAESCVPATQMFQSLSAESAKKYELLVDSCSASAAVGRQKHESELLKQFDSQSSSLSMSGASSRSSTFALVPTTTTYGNPNAITTGERLQYVAPKGPRALNARAVALAPNIRTAANSYDIDPLFLHAIAHVESRHNPNAVSKAGAKGVMQVIPATARRFGMSNPTRDLLNPQLNIEVSSAYLKFLQGRYGNNLPLVLAAYNAGEGAVEKYGRRIPPYAETQGYVREVLNQYRELRTLTPQR